MAARTTREVAGYVAPLVAGANGQLLRPAATALGPRLTYAIAPPNRATPRDRRHAIAAAQSTRISALPIDALLVYDVQDEASRNHDPRPFPFLPKVDPLSYAFDAIEIGAIPRVVYRAVAEQDEASLCRWLDRLQAHHGTAVLVGAPSNRASTSLSLPDAFSVCRRHTPRVSFGGVMIPERHLVSADEDTRVWRKMQQGCSFFVSQTVWSVDATTRLLRDLRLRAKAEGWDPLESTCRHASLSIL